MNKILWLSVSLISMVSLHGMNNDDPTALRASMLCGLATGAAVVGGLGSMAVDYYEKTIDQNNKRSWNDDDSKFEGVCSGFSMAPVVFLAVMQTSNDAIKEISGGDIKKAFLVGLATGAIAGAGLVCIKNHQTKYEAPKWKYVGAFPRVGHVWNHANYKS